MCSSIMDNRQEMAAALRRRLAQNHSVPAAGIRPVGHAGVDACLPGGLKCGALHEVFSAAASDAPAAAGFTLGLAARVAGKGKWLLWVQQDFPALEWGDLLATGLRDFGLDPARFLTVRVPNPALTLRAGAEGLSCGVLGAVVIECWAGARVFDLVASRRLTLSAAKQGVTIFALRHAALPAPGSAETRWRVRAAARDDAAGWGGPRFDAELLRNRHGTTGRWIMEWDCDGRFHDTGAADFGGVSAAPADRPAAPEIQGWRHTA